VGMHRAPTVARAEEQADDPGARQLTDMTEKVLGPVVLVVAVGVVLGVEVLVSFWYLPHDGVAPCSLIDRADEAFPAMEVRKRHVETIPPDGGIVVHVLVVAGISIGDVVKEEIVGAGAGRRPCDSTLRCKASRLL